jgi:hypothetical protein
MQDPIDRSRSCTEISLSIEIAFAAAVKTLAKRLLRLDVHHSSPFARRALPR